MTRKLIIFYFMLVSSAMYSQNIPSLSSPDGNLKLNVLIENGKPMYSVTYNGKTMLENSPIGVITNEGDFSVNMSLTGTRF